MKFTVDTINKTISFEQDCSLKEVIELLPQMLQEWRSYKLVVNTKVGNDPFIMPQLPRDYVPKKPYWYDTSGIPLKVTCTGDVPYCIDQPTTQEKLKFNEQNG